MPRQVLGRLFDRIRTEEPPLPLRLLQMVYRGEVKASPQHMRAAIESLPYEQPKLSAISVGYLDATDFASRLERAINRSRPCEAYRRPRDQG